MKKKPSEKNAEISSVKMNPCLQTLIGAVKRTRNEYWTTYRVEKA